MPGDTTRKPGPGAHSPERVRETFINRHVNAEKHIHKPFVRLSFFFNTIKNVTDALVIFLTFIMQDPGC